jgi:endonuclease YncB( thermonuclease family)
MTSGVRVFLGILAVLVAVHGGAFSSRGGAAPVAVIDGDTMQADGTVIQLYGIDAPELGQLCESEGRLWPCGMDAALALSKLVSLNQSSLRCAPWSSGGAGATDPAPGTELQVCKVGDQDLAWLMLESGNAVALPDAFPDYRDAEAQARQAGLGLWHSDFVPPWQWRAGVASLDRPSDYARACNVKGVVNPDGQRVYYVPTDPAYRATGVDPKRGDTLLCSDDEARQAGWRRPGETASVNE